MRILYVTNGFPFPLTSGYLRHYFLIRELSIRHSITLMSLVPASFDPANITALRPYADDIWVFRRANADRGTFAKTVAGMRLLKGTEPATQSMRSVIAEMSATKAFDVAFVSGKHTMPAIQSLGDVPIVADICDAAS